MEYLPTFPLECGHFEPNVGKYSLHGASGDFNVHTIFGGRFQCFTHMFSKGVAQVPPSCI